MLNSVFNFEVGSIVKLKISRVFAILMREHEATYYTIEQDKILTIVKIEQLKQSMDFQFLFFYDNRLFVNYYINKQQLENSFEKIIC